MMHAKKNNGKFPKLNMKACLAVFLCTVMVLTSVDYIQVQASETNVKETSETTEDFDGGEESTGGDDTEKEPETSSAENEESTEAVETTTADEESTETTTGTETEESSGGSEESTETITAAETEEESNSEESTETAEETDESKEESTETVETEADETETKETVEETEEETESTGGIRFLTTSKGAIVLSGFEPLTDADSRIVLEEKEPLAEVVKKMPSAIKAYAKAYIYTEEEETEGGSESGPEKETESEPESESGTTAETEGEVSTEGDVVSEKETESESAGEVQTAGEEDTSVPTTETDTSAQTTEADTSTETIETGSETEPEIPEKPAETFSQELMIPVTWECDEDYDNTERENYFFHPVWDQDAYYAELNSAPLILVEIDEKMDLKNAVVSTQEELAEALAAGASGITLAADISLTATLTVPASADTVLDGQGFSLYRGTDENGTFTGTMINLGGKDYTADQFGKLTLTNICIDGRTEGNHAGAPTVIDHGSLVMDKGAVIRNNCNFGTDSSGTDAEAVENFGGGIQVYGELAVTKESLITKNFADSLGGGVFLAGDSVLYLYADVVRENSVTKGTGYGADIYASDGSTIYYDSSVDMDREGFYICQGAILVCMQQVDEDEAKDGNVEIYISVVGNSGYTDEQIAEIIKKLEAKGYKVLTDKKIDIDTTDLRDWYVYDHYDTAAGCGWGNGTINNPPQAWQDVYGGNEKRKYYPCTETYYLKGLANPAYTIEEWLARTNEYLVFQTYLNRNQLQLAQFKEHIYRGKQNGMPLMTFVGYGSPSYIDFLYYNPKSDGEKVVNFDVDSLAIDTHTLAGNGFLINTGVENGLLSGYLVYYAYDAAYDKDVVMPVPDLLEVYRINGISVDVLHGSTNGSTNLKIKNSRVALFGNPIASYPIEKEKWEQQMSIQIKAMPDKLEIRQESTKQLALSDIAQSEPIISCTLESTGYSGFGPIVAYTTHSCPSATTFTYFNLSMYYTNPELEVPDMLNPLEQADFTQEGTQKYFLDLFGNSDLQFNEWATFGQYQEYLKMMQEEGIALITDRDTPFDDYLGGGNESDSNLCEMDQTPSVDELVNQIIGFIEGKNTTDMEDKVQDGEGEDGLKPADPKQSVGNIWLKSLADGKQIRKLYGNSFGETGYAVQIMDDIAYYDVNALTVTYYILKPNSSVYVPLTSISPSMGGNVEYLTPASFVIQKDTEAWPAGEYVVRQNISDSSIRGYAYFDLAWEDEPVPPTPPKPAPKPTPAPNPPAEEQIEVVEAQAQPVVQETVVVKAPEPVPEIPSEPKTGDALPALPISVGACTAFMLKIRLWLYEMELGISEEKKNEILQALFSWARGTTKPRVYMAVGASAVVLTLYHLLKALDEKRKRMVEKFGK